MSLKNALTAEYENNYMYGGQERRLNFGVKTDFQFIKVNLKLVIEFL